MSTKPGTAALAPIVRQRLFSCQRRVLRHFLTELAAVSVRS
jgi:hypothetical protein